MSLSRTLAWAAAAMLMSHDALAASGPAGRYRLIGSHDTASELDLRPDGSFDYFLTAGSLDEAAKGRWTVDGKNLHLTTQPKPVPAVFSVGPIAIMRDAPFVLHVTTPEGHGIAAIYFRIGFDAGEPIDDYTQDYGWNLPEDEKRTPRWIEFSLPIYALRSPRFAIDLHRGNAQTFILTPNDLGMIDFADVRIDVAPGKLIMHRWDALLTFDAVAPDKE